MFSFVRDRSLFMDGRGRIFWGRDQFFGKSLMGGAYIWRVPNGGPLFAKKSYVYILFFCCFDKEWAYLCQYSSICDGATFLAIKRPGGTYFWQSTNRRHFLGRVGGPKSPPPLINNEWSLREAPSL